MKIEKLGWGEIEISTDYTSRGRAPWWMRLLRALGCGDINARCMLCGAVVDVGNIDNHTRWHAAEDHEHES